MPTLTYSNAGLALTEQFEGLMLAAYQDAAGVWTIGYGHTGPDVTPGLRITTEEAAELLRRDLAHAVACVHRAVTVPLTQNQFDALVDFTYNLGCGTLQGSTLRKKLNAGDYTGAQAEFARWNETSGKVVDGLVRRRKAEAALFGAPTTPAETAVV